MFPTGGLLPGHVLVHHDNGWWDPIMEFGEWDGLPREDLAATHIDFSLGGFNLAKMNPQVSCLYDGSSLDPKAILVLAIKPLNVPGRGLVDPHTDPIFAACLEVEARTNLGEPYDWTQIYEFSGIGLEARLDDAAAKAAIAKADPINVAKGHYGVCSVWTEARLEAAILKAYGLTVDLTKGDDGAGHDNARPSDWQTFPMLQVIAQLG